MQCISYRNQIIPHFPFQKFRPDKRIDFSLANLIVRQRSFLRRRSRYKRMRTAPAELVMSDPTLPFPREALIPGNYRCPWL